MTRIAAAAIAASLAFGLSSCGHVARFTPQPPSSPRIWYLAGREGTAYAVDWNGRALGSLGAPPAQPGQLPSPYPGKPTPSKLLIESASPDGGRVLFDDGSIRDPTGRVTGRIDPRAGLAPYWADDGSELCQVTTPGFRTFAGGTLPGPYQLTVVKPGSAPRAVATDPGMGFIAACSARHDVAVWTVRQGSAKSPLVLTQRLEAVRISDGTVLARRQYPVSLNPLAGTYTAVSEDGRYVAEVQAVDRAATPSGPTVIRELATGRVVATLGPVWVRAFSGDGTLVAVTSQDSIQLVKWQTNAVVAELPGTFTVSAAEPDGERFVAIKLVSDPVRQNQLWLLGPGATGRMLAPDSLGVYGPSLQT